MCAWRQFRGTSGPRRTLFAPRALKSMQRAHQLMEGGDHANAAVLLFEVAQSALDRGWKSRAAFLYLQTSRAYLMAGQAQEGVATLREGLSLLAEEKRWIVLRRIGQRAQEELSSLGLEEAAKDIEQWLEERLPVQVHNTPALRAADLRGTGLPLKCPSCGAPVRPDELEGIKSPDVECAYCGSLLNK